MISKTLAPDGITGEGVVGDGMGQAYLLVNMKSYIKLGIKISIILDIGIFQRGYIMSLSAC